MKSTLGTLVLCAALSLGVAVGPNHATAMPVEGGAVPTGDGRSSPQGCPGCPMGENEFIWRAVTYNRGLTAAEARGIYRNRPRVRNQIIVYKTWSSAARGGPSPADTPASGGPPAPTVRGWCQVTTSAKGRNLWFAVVTSFTQRQRWNYDGWRVYPQRSVVWYDTTDNNWAWHFESVNFSQNYYTQKNGSRYAIHTALRGSLWESITMPGGGPLKATLATKIAKYWHGGWKTYRSTHSQCED